MQKAKSSQHHFTIEFVYVMLVRVRSWGKGEKSRLLTKLMNREYVNRFMVAQTTKTTKILFSR